MIQRVVTIKLKAAYANDDDREKVADKTREVLPQAEGVNHVVVGLPADGRTRREWDLVILVQLDDLDAVERYRTDKVHRAYVDVFLKPMMDSIRVWNFELD